MAEYDDDNYNGLDEGLDTIDENFDTQIDMRNLTRDRNMRAQAKGGGFRDALIAFGAAYRGDTDKYSKGVSDERATQTAEMIAQGRSQS